MVDEMRTELARLAEPVRPRPDPYHRLLARARRRRRRALAGSSALAAIVVAVPLFLTTVGLPGSQVAAPSGLVEYEPPTPIGTPLARRLVESPTRGNLSGDRTLIDEIERAYFDAREELVVDPALDDVRVLFADDRPNVRSVVVAFVDRTRATIRRGSADYGASPRALLDKTGTWAADNGAPTGSDSILPYVFTSRASPTSDGHVVDYQLGLAPAGCVAETSVDGRLRADGTVERSWQPEGADGYIVRGAGAAGERWRFTCDDEVQFVGPSTGGGMVRAPRPDAAAVPIEGARGIVDPRTAANAVRELTETLGMNGMVPTGTPRVVWGGRLDGTTRDAVLVQSCAAGGGCAALLSRDPDEVSAARGARSAIAVGRTDLVAVRVPDSDQVLVIGPPEATRAELLGVDGSALAEGELADGVGVLPHAVGADRIATVRVFDDRDRVVASMPAAPNLGSAWFGEPVIEKW